MKKILSVLFLFFTFLTVKGAKVDTIEVYSPAMKKKIKTVVILPENLASEKKYPVLYFLHGYGGNYSQLVRNMPDVVRAVDIYNFMVVCPDGGFGSWYWDSPIDPGFKYETFVSSELVKSIDERYPTMAEPKGRGICGLSMGGHGALSVAIKHQDVFGAAGSSSGGVDFRPFYTNWDIAKRIGEYRDHPEEWDQRVAVNLIPKITKKLKIFMDCGKDDFFYPVNKAFHEKLDYFNIEHIYMRLDGKHDWDYWRRSLPYQFLFFDTFFKQKN